MADTENTNNFTQPGDIDPSKDVLNNISKDNVIKFQIETKFIEKEFAKMSADLSKLLFTSIDNALTKNIVKISKNLGDNVEDVFKKSTGKSFTKNLEKSVQKATKNADLISPKNIKNLDKALKDNTKVFSKTLKDFGNSFKNNLQNTMKNIKEDTKKAVSSVVAPLLAGFSIASLVGKVVQSFKTLDELRGYAFQMYSGKQAIGVSGGLVDNVTNAGALSVSLEQAFNIEKSLLAKKIEYNKISSQTIKLYEASNRVLGLSDQAFTTLFQSQIKFFNQSQKQFKETLNAVSTMQHTYQMTGEEADAVVQSMTTLQNKAIGFFDSKKVDSFQKSFLTLSGTIAQVGIDLSKASSLMESFVDPLAMQKNITLLTRLGYSVQDVLSGNIGGKNTMTSRLQGFAQQIAQVASSNRMQAAVMTQSITGGQFSLEDMMKMARGEKVEQTKEKTITDVYSLLSERNETITAKLTQISNGLEQGIFKVGDKLFNQLSKLFTEKTVSSIVNFFVKAGEFFGKIIDIVGDIIHFFKYFGKYIEVAVMNIKNGLFGKSKRYEVNESGQIVESTSVKYQEKQENKKQQILNDLEQTLNSPYVQKQIEEDYGKFSIANILKYMKKDKEFKDKSYAFDFAKQWGIDNKIPANFQGNLITTPTITAVGEKEPEWIIPKSKLNQFIEAKKVDEGNTEKVARENKMLNLLERLVDLTEKQAEEIERLRKYSTTKTLLGKA